MGTLFLLLTAIFWILTMNRPLILFPFHWLQLLQRSHFIYWKLSKMKWSNLRSPTSKIYELKIFHFISLKDLTLPFSSRLPLSKLPENLKTVFCSHTLLFKLFWLIFCQLRLYRWLFALSCWLLLLPESKNDVTKDYLGFSLQTEKSRTSSWSQLA